MFFRSLVLFSKKVVTIYIPTSSSRELVHHLSLPASSILTKAKSSIKTSKSVCTFLITKDGWENIQVSIVCISSLADSSMSTSFCSYYPPSLFNLSDSLCQNSTCRTQYGFKLIYLLGQYSLALLIHLSSPPHVFSVYLHSPPCFLLKCVCLCVLRFLPLRHGLSCVIYIGYQNLAESLIYIYMKQPSQSIRLLLKGS